VPASERCAANDRRLLHDDEAGVLEVLNTALGRDRGRVLVGVVNGLSALKAQGEGERVATISFAARANLGARHASEWSAKFCPVRPGSHGASPSL